MPSGHLYAPDEILQWKKKKKNITKFEEKKHVVA